MSSSCKIVNWDDPSKDEIRTDYLDPSLSPRVSSKNRRKAHLTGLPGAQKDKAAERNPKDARLNATPQGHGAFVRQESIEDVTYAVIVVAIVIHAQH